MSEARGISEHVTPAATAAHKMTQVSILGISFLVFISRDPYFLSLYVMIILNTGGIYLVTRFYKQKKLFTSKKLNKIKTLRPITTLFLHRHHRFFSFSLLVVHSLSHPGHSLSIFPPKTCTGQQVNKNHLILFQLGKFSGCNLL